MDPRILTDLETIGETREYSCHTVDEPGSWQYEPHRHAGCCDLTFLYRGSLDQAVNGHRTLLTEGMMTLVRDGDLHALRSRGLVMFTINFRPRALVSAGDFLRLDDRVSQMLSTTAAPVFRTELADRSGLLLDFQSLLYNQHRPEGRLLFGRFLVRWLVDIVAATPSAAPVELPQWMADLLNHIDADVELPVSVADLARVAGKSAEHVARCFRSYLDTTPSQAINAARLHRAALLLAHTNRSVLDICYSLGYNSASYFYRLFGREYAMPPYQYRRENSVLHGSPIGPATARARTGLQTRRS